MSVDIPAIMKKFPENYIPGAVSKTMTIYFSIGDDASGKWTLVIDPEKADIQAGKTVEQADLVLKTSPEIFKKLVLDNYTPGAMDFIRGRIKSNDPEGLRILRTAFRQA